MVGQRLSDCRSRAGPSAEHLDEPDFWIISGRSIIAAIRWSFVGRSPPGILKPTWISEASRSPSALTSACMLPSELRTKRRRWRCRSEPGPFDGHVEKAIANEDAFSAVWRSGSPVETAIGVKVIGIDETISSSIRTCPISTAHHEPVISWLRPSPGLLRRSYLGISPRRFSATGEHQTISYHQELESIQAWIHLLL